ncbi:MAG: carbamoyl-phosphate synthase large subunit, partial [Limosilactobacillus reuteri]|nr:carbamoyl-phosphate synthase large subunit [Limosilactobacillus reuteri]
NGDEKEVLPLAKRFAQIGYQVFTTPQTASHFKDNGIHIHQEISNIDELNCLLKAGQIDLVINTMRHDYEQDSLGFQIRQSTIAQNVPLMTSLDTVNALLHVKEDQSLEAITIK